MEYVYGVLLLHKTGQEINEANLKKVVAATGVSVDESKVKSLIASLKGVNIDEQLANATLAVAAPSGPVEVKKEAAAEGLSALIG